MEYGFEVNSLVNGFYPFAANGQVWEYLAESNK